MIQHLPGKGRNQGRMGSLLIEMDNGIRFRLGGGFKDAERENPPSPGARIVSNIMDTQKQISLEWLRISGLIWRFDNYLRLKIASVDKNSRINQCDQNHWWYPAW